ncbi:MAG: type 2 isopentenyl-diphosphate Delta-isomerase [Rhizobiaceae bacterium]
MTTPSIRNRKLDHVKLAMESRNTTLVNPGWDGIRLSPVALPMLDVGDIDLAVEFLGHGLKAPLIIAGMTGGHVNTESINANLAIAANECGVAMGVGSQRAAMQDISLVPSYSVVRRHAPKAFICGNIGISQLVGEGMNSAAISYLIDMVEADVVAVHINVLQELVQPEGGIALSNAFSELADFIDRCPVPVIVKETGCGLDQKTAFRLKEIGVAALDVGGVGGTSFVQIEGARAEQMGDTRKTRLAKTFARWGLPTAASLLQVKDVGLPLIATGGICSGLDVAKALVLGADLVGIGRQILAAALEGPEETVEELQTIIEELTIAMVLTESVNIAALNNVGVEAV